MSGWDCDLVVNEERWHAGDATLASGIEDRMTRLLADYATLPWGVLAEAMLLRATANRLREMAEGAGLLARATPGTRAVVAERNRQMIVEGYTEAHDDAHSSSALSWAASCYLGAAIRGVTAATPEPAPLGWPFGVEAWKPKDTRHNLVRAAALIIAEIDRLDRAAEADDRASAGPTS